MQYELNQVVSFCKSRYSVESILGSHDPNLPYLRVRDLKTGAHCAVRFSKKSMRNEAKVLHRARSHCPRLPRVICFGSHGREHHLVTTWAGGVDDLNKIWSRDRAQGRDVFGGPSALHRVMTDLAKDLQALHSHAQIVHGDIKPENLAVAKDGSGLILIDFGISWKIEQTARRPLGSRGTVSYAAPELWDARPRSVGAAADQFSLAAVYYELLTNELPYEKLGGQVVRLTDPGADRRRFVPASKANRTVGPRLDAVLERSLSLEASQRYPTTRQWIEALEAAVPTSAASRLARRFVRSLSRWNPGTDQQDNQPKDKK